MVASAPVAGSVRRGPTHKIVKDFDKNNNGWLNAEERAPARESLKKGGAPGGGMRGTGGFGRGNEPATLASPCRQPVVIAVVSPPPVACTPNP